MFDLSPILSLPSPSHSLCLVSFYLTCCWQVDRGALPAPSLKDMAASQYVAPVSPVERTLCNLCAEVLGLDRVGLQVLSRVNAGSCIELLSPSP